MKRIMILMALFTTISFAQAQSDKDKFDPETCRCKGKVMMGKVRVVTIGEDVKVRVVTIGEELQVRKTNFPEYCGEWQIVTIGEDFTIRFVTIGEDIMIRYTDFTDYRLKTPQDSRYVN